jgi:hypothetical protein
MPGPGRSARTARHASRVACHLTAAAVFSYALIEDLRHGWRATGDDAIIAQRSWSVLTLHPPLVGQFSQGSGGIAHTYYDPGPLLFWLLALPVRVDPVHGILWGAALLCLVGMVLAIEAAWAFRGVFGGVAVVAALAVIACTQSFVVVDPAWNPSVGVVWFIATLACAASVGSGRLRWWPALVLAASMAAQSHLEFTATSIALVILGLASGLVRRNGPIPGRWLASGVGVGLLCWIAPVVQEVTGRPGNLTVAWDWLSGQPGLGVRFGLESLASVTDFRPLWLSTQNRGSNADAFLGLLVHIEGHGAGFGLFVLVSLAAVTGGAWLAGRRDLATLAAIALVAATIGVWTFAALPTASVLTIVYADVVLWPVGMVVWVVWLWALLTPAAAPVATVRSRPPTWATSGAVRAGAGWLTVLGVLAVGTVGAGVAAATVPSPHLGVLGGWQAVDLVPAAVAAVDRADPTGPVAVYVEGPDSDADYSLAYGVIWQLHVDGREATATAPHWQPLGPRAAPAPDERRVSIRVRNSVPTVTSTSSHHPRPPDPPRATRATRATGRAVARPRSPGALRSVSPAVPVGRPQLFGLAAPGLGHQPEQAGGQ